jgi:TonB-dependent outer membrane receptor, SusC/RagA subfamily, signature region
MRTATLRRIPLLFTAALLAACQSAPKAPAATSSAPGDSVHVAYGTQARRDVTGAVSSVDGDVAQRTSPTSMADLLDGRFAGVDVRALPGGGMSVRIRGSRSFKGDGEPLYVVDGIPQHAGTNGILRDLDPRLVQSVEVLKDAGATAAYGARGANGVILITTRHPD